MSIHLLKMVLNDGRYDRLRQLGDAPNGGLGAKVGKMPLRGVGAVTAKARDAQLNSLRIALSPQDVTRPGLRRNFFWRFLRQLRRTGLVMFFDEFAQLIDTPSPAKQLVELRRLRKLYLNPGAPYALSSDAGALEDLGSELDRVSDLLVEGAVAERAAVAAALSQPAKEDEEEQLEEEEEDEEPRARVLSDSEQGPSSSFAESGVHGDRLNSSHHSTHTSAAAPGAGAGSGKSSGAGAGSGKGAAGSMAGAVSRATGSSSGSGSGRGAAAPGFDMSGKQRGERGGLRRSHSGYVMHWRQVAHRKITPEDQQRREQAQAMLREVFQSASALALEQVAQLLPVFLDSELARTLACYEAFASVPREVCDYAKLCVLGEGGFGKVHAVQCTDTQKRYALKEMSKLKIVQKKRSQTILNEAKILKKLGHPFCARLHQVMSDELSVYFLLDLLPGGDLKYHVKRMPLVQHELAQFWAACLVLAVEHLHSRNVLHRDIKLANCLLDADGYAVLCDFGLSVTSDEPRPIRHGHCCGTAGYIAPEMLLGPAWDRRKEKSQQVDVVEEDNNIVRRVSKSLRRLSGSRSSKVDDAKVAMARTTATNVLLRQQSGAKLEQDQSARPQPQQHQHQQHQQRQHHQQEQLSPAAGSPTSGGATWSAASPASPLALISALGDLHPPAPGATGGERRGTATQQQPPPQQQQQQQQQQQPLLDYAEELYGFEELHERRSRAAFAMTRSSAPDAGAVAAAAANAAHAANAAATAAAAAAAAAAAPETEADDASGVFTRYADYGSSVDWFSLGVTIHQMFSYGRLPFSRGIKRSNRQLLQNMQEGNVLWSGTALAQLERNSKLTTVANNDPAGNVKKSKRPVLGLTQAAKDLVEQMLVFDPALRLGCGARGVQEIKEHPFFDGIDWITVGKKHVVPPFVPASGQLNAEFRPEDFEGGVEGPSAKLRRQTQQTVDEDSARLFHEVEYVRPSAFFDEIQECVMDYGQVATPDQRSRLGAACALM
jgi:serine/threonine protein kinase